jgi:rhodanese-related sulfurtransferase
MNRLIGIIFTVFIAISGCGQEKTFDEKARSMVNETVPLIMPEECQSDYIFLDAREAEEYEVSHIKGAIPVGYDEFSLEGVTLSRADTIVVYCSIGYRSEKIGEKLQEQGYDNVYNLYGGVFKWMNDGKPIYNDGKETDRIHTYNKKWSQWVYQGEKIY